MTLKELKLFLLENAGCNGYRTHYSKKELQDLLVLFNNYMKGN